MSVIDKCLAWPRLGIAIALMIFDYDEKQQDVELTHALSILKVYCYRLIILRSTTISTSCPCR